MITLFIYIMLFKSTNELIGKSVITGHFYGHLPGLEVMCVRCIMGNLDHTIRRIKNKDIFRTDYTVCVPSFCDMS